MSHIPHSILVAFIWLDILLLDVHVSHNSLPGMNLLRYSLILAMSGATCIISRKGTVAPSADDIA